MQSSQRLRQLLVSSGQTPERQPAKAALNYPAARQQHKAAWLLAASPRRLYAMFASFIGGSVTSL